MGAGISNDVKSLGTMLYLGNVAGVGCALGSCGLRETGSGFRRSETRESAENAYAEMDKVELKIQGELEVAEIVQTEKSSDGDKRVDRSENNSEPARAGDVRAKSGSKSDHSTYQVEKIVRHRKSKIEHFVAEESGDAHNN